MRGSCQTFCILSHRYDDSCMVGDSEHQRLKGRPPLFMHVQCLSDVIATFRRRKNVGKGIECSLACQPTLVVGLSKLQRMQSPFVEQNDTIGLGFGAFLDFESPLVS